MSICIATINFPNYKELAEKTIPNKMEYCQRHGYVLAQKHSDFTGDLALGFEKIKFLRELCSNTNNQWIFFLGCDTLIMNFSIKIEDIISLAAPHQFLIIATDAAGVNADSFILRNTKQGREWLELIWNKRVEFNEEYPYEQGAMWKYNQQFGDGIRIVPQKMINSYDYAEKEKCEHHRDRLGNYGGFSDGDFIVHWPTRSLRERLSLYKKYSKRIQK